MSKGWFSNTRTTLNPSLFGATPYNASEKSACTKYIIVPREQNLCDSEMFLWKWQIRTSASQICLENISKWICMVIGHWNNIVVRTGEEACVGWISWQCCLIACTSKICLDWLQENNFELNFNLQLWHSCNQNIQNIVTWSQNASANIEEFACVSIGWLFSGVPPNLGAGGRGALVTRKLGKTHKKKGNIGKGRENRLKGKKILSPGNKL